MQLPHPSPAQPYIKGLLDPCTNSMTAPNIPAEKLYDKKVFLRSLLVSQQPKIARIAFLSSL